MKVVAFRIEEVVFDPADAARALEKACMRHGRCWRITCCCSDGDGLLVFPVESAGNQSPQRYCFTRFPDLSFDSITTELRIRFEKGMSCLGTFRRDDELWGFFCCQ